MKNITLLFSLLIATSGFAQVNLEDFEGTTGFTAEEGLSQANVVADPLDSGNTVGEIISSSIGDPWQNARLVMQDNFMDLTTDVTVQVDVYSTTSFTMLAKVEDAVQMPASAASGAAQDYVTGSGWQTLTFTFDQVVDNLALANGEYSLIGFFPNWAGNGSGNNGVNPDWNDPLDFTVYIDNITAVQGMAFPETCTDGEQNNGETGIDCGGPNCDACVPAAPIPNTPDGETYSIYNDTNNFSTVFPVLYDFGTLGDEPDLDLGAAENKALKFDFSFAGYGQGEGGPDDVSTYGFVNFMYWAVPGVPGFQFRMISNNGAVQEFTYEIGTQEAIVIEQWTQVSIPMSYFTNLGFSSANFYQWKCEAFMQVVTNPGTVYIDNIILTSNALSITEYDTTEFKIYPNPTTSDWNVISNAIVTSVVVYDILGKQVMVLSPNTTNLTIDASSLNSGMYFAEINGVKGSKTVKLIKE